MIFTPTYYPLLHQSDESFLFYLEFHTQMCTIKPLSRHSQHGKSFYLCDANTTQGIMVWMPACHTVCHLLCVKKKKISCKLVCRKCTNSTISIATLGAHECWDVHPWLGSCCRGDAAANCVCMGGLQQMSIMGYCLIC